jgi:hypothetical protein
MKKYIILTIMGLITCRASYSQNNDTLINLNMLNAPIAPAFTILGIEPTSIEEPTTPTDLLISVRNKTNNFSSFPTDYALSFSPGWVFGGSKITYESFQSGKNIWQNIKQSSVFSIATHTNESSDSINSNQIGVGFKFSIFRGTVDEDYDSLRQRRLLISESLSNLNDEFKLRTEQLTSKDKTWLQLDSIISDELKKETKNKELLQTLLGARDKRENQIMNNYESGFKEDVTAIKLQASKLKFERRGFKLDLGLGLGYDFANQKWGNGRLFRYGIWLNGGKVYPLQNRQSFVWLLSSRLLMFPSELYEKDSKLLTANNLRFDYGGRMIYKFENKLSISSEVLFRQILNNKDIENTYKFTLNFDYQILPNQVLTFSLGRDFDGVINKSGNLITALNLIVGFGNKRPF